MKRVIAVLDKNKDGKISFAEFIEGLSYLSASGVINWNRYHNFLGVEEDKLKFAFKIYDMNDDGFITNGELFTVRTSWKIGIFRNLLNNNGRGHLGLSSRD